MDVNQTRFHLITGLQDWAAARDESTAPGGFEWDDGKSAIQLKRQPQRFLRGRRSAPLELSARRGAAADRFGSWYWISQDRSALYRAASGTRRAHLYWQPGPPPPAQPGSFAPPPVPITPLTLSGLAVTSHHYLLVGSLDPAGLLIFDLHSGGEPMLLGFEPGFEPTDIAASPDGGAWILEGGRHQLWRIDRYFRLCALVITSPPGAAPTPGEFLPEVTLPLDELPPLPAPAPLLLPVLDPASIECMPDGSLLVLDAPAAPGSGSRLQHYQVDAAGYPFLSSTQELPPPQAGGPPIVGHDLAYLAQEERLVVVERDGNQAFAYRLPLPHAGQVLAPLVPLPDYLPMHYFGSRAVVAAPAPWGGACDDCPTLETAVYYDVTPGVAQRDLATRWVALREIDQPQYARQAALVTQRLDGRTPGCTWHRLVIDGCIPPETSVRVETRAGDDPNLLAFQPFLPEPPLYLRQAGAEIPYYRPFSGDPVEYRGTWELLFQQAKGRYLEIRLVLNGNGRATPSLQALRAWYPRFSYVEHYLPAAYRDEPTSASFLERMLANFEGFYSELEGKIAAFPLLLDPRSAPAESLDWLGLWLGLVMDPLWARLQEERGKTSMLSLTADGLSQPDDRRRLMIRFAMRLYTRRGTLEGMRFALLLLLDPCLEAVLARLKQAARRPDLGLRSELAALGLPYPTPSTTEDEYEEILYRYALNSPRSRRVRLVERWQTRQGGARQAGDPTSDDPGSAAAPANSPTAIRAAAHRFSVLVPEGLSQAESAMVERIVQLEKPAHTAFDVRRFWDFFRVGEARLGIDTALGEEGRFLPIVLGRDYLSEGYLESAHPMNITERTVSDRDALGEMHL